MSKKADQASYPHTEPQRSVSRRSVVKGAVWAAPVVALSVTAPAHAASECTNFVQVLGSCSLHDNSAPGYVTPSFSFSNYTCPLNSGSRLAITGPGAGNPSLWDFSALNQAGITQYVVTADDPDTLVILFTADTPGVFNVPSISAVLPFDSTPVSYTMNCTIINATLEPGSNLIDVLSFDENGECSTIFGEG
ncbi:hypothetical protein [Microbacterium sp. YY-01]|uniref:hypothetical protein n=1 Tax=Microbacterium sp. YY-01 TaxID=3421634 RepID=UPI003D165A9A